MRSCSFYIRRILNLRYHQRHAPTISTPAFIDRALFIILKLRWMRSKQLSWRGRGSQSQNDGRTVLIASLCTQLGRRPASPGHNAPSPEQNTPELWVCGQNVPTTLTIEVCAVVLRVIIFHCVEESVIRRRRSTYSPTPAVELFAAAYRSTVCSVRASNVSSPSSCSKFTSKAKLVSTIYINRLVVLSSWSTLTQPTSTARLGASSVHRRDVQSGCGASNQRFHRTSDICMKRC